MNPNIELEICIQAADPLFAAVDYHIDTVIKRTNVIGFLEDFWVKFFRIYQDIFWLPAGVTIHDFDVAVANARDRYDRLNSTPNNWESMLLAGLAENPQAKAFLFHEIEQQRAGNKSPDQY